MGPTRSGTAWVLGGDPLVPYGGPLGGSTARGEGGEADGGDGEGTHRLFGGGEVDFRQVPVLPPGYVGSRGAKLEQLHFPQQIGGPFRGLPGANRCTAVSDGTTVGGYIRRKDKR